MKLLALLNGVIGVLLAAHPHNERAPPPAEEQPILVYDLTQSDDWDQAIEWAKNETGFSPEMVEAGIEKHLLVTFFAPWCGHCKRMIPNMLDASHHFRTWEQADLVRFGRVDCTSAKKRCSNYGVYSYPTILWLDSKGGLVAEFPQGPRSSEAFLSFVASELRRKAPAPLMAEQWSSVYSTLTQTCRNAATRMERSYVNHLCKANLIHNVIVGGKRGIEKLMEAVPDIAEKHAVFSLMNEEMLESDMESPNDVCWQDNLLERVRNCVNTDGPDAIKELRRAARRYANPLVYTEATWETFFQARRELPKATVLLAGSVHHVSDYKEWYDVMSEIAMGEMRDDAVFLETSVGAPLAKVFEQMGTSDMPLPWIGMWMGPWAKQEFFHFEGAKEDLEEWLHRVWRGEIAPFYRAHKSWWQNVREEVSTLGTVGRRAWRNAPWHQKALIGGGLAVILAGLWAINHFLPSEEDEVLRLAQQSAAATAAGEQAAAVADEGAAAVPGEGAAAVAATTAGDEGETTGTSAELIDDSTKEQAQTVRQRMGGA